MNEHRKTARLVGAMFILALVPFLIGQAIYEPILGSQDYLDNAYPNRVSVTIGIMLEITSVIAMVLIPILLFPILRMHNEVLALGYIGFRLFEAVLLTIAQVYKLSLVNLSQYYLDTGGMEAADYESIGDFIQSVLYWVDHAGLVYLIIFVIGGLILYSALYKSKLIPRWLSIWGLIGAVAILVASFIATFEIFPEIVALLFMMVIAVQEQVMGIWLIIKGFNPVAMTSDSTN